MAIKVNGVEIPVEAIEYELKRLVQFYSEHMSRHEVQNQIGALRQKAREQAIGGRLLMEQAARLDIKVAPADVDARVKKMVEKAGGRPKFEALLKKQQFSEDRLRQSIEQGRKVDLLVERIAADAAEPTEEELQQYYEQNAGQYTMPEQAEVQHILIKPSSDSREDRSATRSRLLSIRQEILEGSDFAGQAAAHSECPSGKRSGGNLGWVAKGTMIPEFENAVFTVGVGEVSDVTETRMGMHLIRKTAQKKSEPAPFAEVREKIRDFLRHSRRGERLAAYVKELRAKAVIEED